jgi:hypothetical protein
VGGGDAVVPTGKIAPRATWLPRLIEEGGKKFSTEEGRRKQKKEVGRNLSSREREVTVAEVESGHKKLTHARSLLLD